MSGDCQNGYGILDIDYGHYEGQFRNGNFNGSGKFTYTNVASYGIVYVGNFVNGNFEGYGKMTFGQTDKASDYYMGNFVNGVRQGKGLFVYRDGTRLNGNFENNQFKGLGVETKGRLSHLNYWDYPGYDHDRGVPLDLLTKHQDTVFSKFKKCNCLDPVNIPMIGFENVSQKYDEYDNYGVKVGEKTKNESSPYLTSGNGLINSTGHDIYIRAYLKSYFWQQDATEYTDVSYIVSPGQKIMNTYREVPDGSDLAYYQKDFIFVGQYCEKTLICNSPKAEPKKVSSIGNAAVNKKKFTNVPSTINVDGSGASYNKIFKTSQKITLIPSGRILLGMFAGYSGPDGINGFDQYKVISKFRHGALLARYNGGAWFSLSEAYTFTAKSNGKIEFLINDSDSGNNNGSYIVEIHTK